MQLRYDDPVAVAIPTVLTRRLMLRSWTFADIEPYAEMNADPETTRYQNGPFGLAATERLVTHLAGMWIVLGYGMWAIEDRVTGKFLGRAGTYYADGWPGVEIAVSIHRSRWGEGLGTEAAGAALAFGFTALDLSELITVTHQDNAAMNAIARSLGMTFTGVATVGPWQDRNVYTIAKATWAEGAPVAAGD